MNIRSDTDSVVLVEGESDRQAVLALADRLGRDLEDERVEVVAMGGATNIASYVARLSTLEPTPLLTGLCDENELRFFEKVLGADDIFVCATDLETELISAIGPDEMVRFIEAQGELKAFQIFQKQPAQRDRTLEEHLHRFCGTLSGRKIRYAQAMINWVGLDAMPRPLLAVLDAV